MEPSAKLFQLIFGSRLAFSNEWDAVALKQAFDFQTMTIECCIDPRPKCLVTFAQTNGDVVLKEKRLVFRSVGDRRQFERDVLARRKIPGERSPDGGDIDIAGGYCINDPRWRIRTR